MTRSRSRFEMGWLKDIADERKAKERAEEVVQEVVQEVLRKDAERYRIKKLESALADVCEIVQSSQAMRAT